MHTYRLTLIAVLSALAVVGRFSFNYLPNIQPVTSLIIICGFFLGPISAIALAVLTTYLSNLVLGMGLWTVWQIVAWALIGVVSGLFSKLAIRRPFYMLIIFAVLSGYLYGLIISLATYSVTGKFVPYYLAGLPFDTYHAIGNGIFMAILFPILSKIFKRYNDKWSVPKIPTNK